MENDIDNIELYVDSFSTPWGVVEASYSSRGLQELILPLPGRSGGAGRSRAPSGRKRRERPWPRLRKQVLAYCEGEGQDFDLPLDIEPPGDFTARAWTAARAIPYGKTVTYGEMAQMLGRPGGARAVGQAMGRNPVPLIIPCHRVVGAAGPGGFAGCAGGMTVTLKLRLLSRETQEGPPRLTAGRKRGRGRRR